MGEPDIKLGNFGRWRIVTGSNSRKGKETTKKRGAREFHFFQYQSFREEVNTWRIQKNDNTYYYGVLDNVKGKSMPITFLAISDDTGKIFDVSIIKYRESYGGEIRNKNWLKQFSEYTDISNYKLGNGIHAISGATISVQSISKGIHKLALIINDVMESFY